MTLCGLVWDSVACVCDSSTMYVATRFSNLEYLGVFCFFLTNLLPSLAMSNSDTPNRHSSLPHDSYQLALPLSQLPYNVSSGISHHHTQAHRSQWMAYVAVLKKACHPSLPESKAHFYSLELLAHVQTSDLQMIGQTLLLILLLLYKNYYIIFFINESDTASGWTRFNINALIIICYL